MPATIYLGERVASHRVPERRSKFSPIFFSHVFSTTHARFSEVCTMFIWDISAVVGSEGVLITRGHCGYQAMAANSLRTVTTAQRL
jgi:hypothetical protein